MGTEHSADLRAALGIVRTIGVNEFGCYAPDSARGCDPIPDGMTEVVEACDGDLVFDGLGFPYSVCGTETGYTP